MTTLKPLVRSIEVNVTEHCNLKCYGCDHAAPVHAEAFLSVEAFKKDLAAAVAAVRAVQFKFTGGEPTLHPELEHLIDALRDSGICSYITLVTNGVLLHKMDAAIWRKIDVLWVSIYPGVNIRLSRDEIQKRADEYDTVLYYKETPLFFRKLLNQENTDSRLVQDIYDHCGLRMTCQTIHNGRYYPCSPAPFIPEWIAKLQQPSIDTSTDSVSLYDDPSVVKAKLHDRLNSREPLAACRYCLGAFGEMVPVTQMNRKAADDWLAEKHSSVEELLDHENIRGAKEHLSSALGRIGATLPARWVLGLP
jgi:MoaA/NifB/PqqE/SkfB family radical SAM enzyme